MSPGLDESSSQSALDNCSKALKSKEAVAEFVKVHGSCPGASQVSFSLGQSSSAVVAVTAMLMAQVRAPLQSLSVQEDRFHAEAKQLTVLCLFLWLG